MKDMRLLILSTMLLISVASSACYLGYLEAVRTRGQTLCKENVDQVPYSHSLLENSHKKVEAKELDSNACSLRLFKRLVVSRGCARPGHITSLSYSPDGQKLLAACNYLTMTERYIIASDETFDGSGTIILWDLTTDQEILSIVKPDQSVRDVCFSNDGSVIASCWGKSVHLHEALSGNAVCSFQVAHDEARAVSYLPCCTSILSASASTARFRTIDGSLQVWDSETGMELMTLANGKALSHLTVSPNGAYFALAGHADMVVIEAATGEEILIKGLVESSLGLLFSPDSSLLAILSSDGMIRIWNIATGDEVSRIMDPVHRPVAVAFCPDGSALISRGCDDTLRLWCHRTGKEVGRIKCCTGQLIAIAPDGKTIALGNDDGSVSVMLLQIEKAAIPIDSRVYASKTIPNKYELEYLWSELASRDPGQALNAILAMSENPEKAVSFMRQRLNPVILDSVRLSRLFADLDDESFDVRESASKELVALDIAVRPIIRKKLMNMNSGEVHRRLGHILEVIESPFVQSPDILRSLRAIQALERIRTKEANDLLKDMASGHPAPRQTKAANRALACVQQR